MVQDQHRLPPALRLSFLCPFVGKALINAWAVSLSSVSAK
jgi:hypothetical protein